jgi:hypothetical protein
LNSFSKEAVDEAIHLAPYELKINRIVDVETKMINDIVEQYFKNNVDFVSIDTEGFEFEIIKSFNFAKCRPAVFCIEVEAYQQPIWIPINNTIENYMLDNNYFVYADTRLNKIFVDSLLLSNLKNKT